MLRWVRPGVLALLLAVPACGAPPIPSANTLVEVDNHSDRLLDDVTLVFPGAGNTDITVRFGNLWPHTNSRLHAGDGASTCWHFHATVDGKPFARIPIDTCLMPHTLGHGRFTCAVNQDQKGHLMVEFPDGP